MKRTSNKRLLLKKENVRPLTAKELKRDELGRVVGGYAAGGDDDDDGRSICSFTRVG